VNSIVNSSVGIPTTAQQTSLVLLRLRTPQCARSKQRRRPPRPPARPLGSGSGTHDGHTDHGIQRTSVPATYNTRTPGPFISDEVIPAPRDARTPGSLPLGGPK